MRITANGVTTLTVCVWLSLVASCLAAAKPTSGAIEFERQRLVHIAGGDQHHSRLQHQPQRLPTKREPSAEETRRILDGIHQINVQMGYIKLSKPQPKSPQSRANSAAEGYFYPRPAYHPLNQMSAYLNAAPRQLPFEYSLPSVYVQLPPRSSSNADGRRNNRQMVVDSNRGAGDYFAYLNGARDAAGGTANDMSREKAMLVNTVKRIVSDLKASDQRNKTTDNAVLLGKKRKSVATKQQLENRPPQTSIIVVSPMNDKRLAEYQHSRAVTDNITNSVKNFFSKPFKGRVTPATPLDAQLKASPSPLHHPLHQNPRPQHSTSAQSSSLMEMVMSGAGQSSSKTTNNVNDANAPDDEEDEYDAEPKGPFSSYFENQKEQVVEALKSGGVIIQRLRVREGGIAIAGPNGVATAGSGGTAIVGPGGIALTHPRSLAIAGPGARVFAVPETTDLQALAMRSNARSLLSSDEGVLVATGPIVYYNPEVGLAPEAAIDFEAV